MGSERVGCCWLAEGGEIGRRGAENMRHDHELASRQAGILKAVAATDRKVIAISDDIDATIIQIEIE